MPTYLSTNGWRGEHEFGMEAVERLEDKRRQRKGASTKSPHLNGFSPFLLTQPRTATPRHTSQSQGFWMLRHEWLATPRSARAFLQTAWRGKENVGRKNACGGAKTLTYNSNHDPVFKLNEEAQNKNFDAVWHDVPSGIWD